jgi:hypothetical protein
MFGNICTHERWTLRRRPPAEIIRPDCGDAAATGDVIDRRLHAGDCLVILRAQLPPGTLPSASAAQTHRRSKDADPERGRHKMQVWIGLASTEHRIGELFEMNPSKRSCDRMRTPCIGHASVTFRRGRPIGLLAKRHTIDAAPHAQHDALPHARRENCGVTSLWMAAHPRRREASPA